ncbi:MAG: pseudouridine synthase, partial [Bacteroidota bacterium]
MKRQLDWLLRSKGAVIVFEDESVIVVNKPARLLVLPDRYDRTLANLHGILAGELGKIYVVHRIDRETSGVIVFAKTGEAHRNLCRQFQGREVETVYQAIVLGAPADREGVIDAPLSERPGRKG